MIIRGECLACTKLGSCREATVDRVLTSYTCLLFQPVQEPVYLARWETMQKLGDHRAVSAMLALNADEETSTGDTEDV
jgi:hypothetical protein